MAIGLNRCRQGFIYSGFDVIVKICKSSFYRFLHVHWLGRWNRRIECHRWTIECLIPFHGRPINWKFQGKHGFSKHFGVFRTIKTTNLVLQLTIFRFRRATIRHRWLAHREQYDWRLFVPLDDNVAPALPTHTVRYNLHYKIQDHQVLHRMCPNRLSYPYPVKFPTMMLLASQLLQCPNRPSFHGSTIVCSMLWSVW